MPTQDSQIRQVILDYFRQPSDQRGTQVDITNNLQTVIADICRKRVPGFTDDDVDRVYEIFYELSLERIIVPGNGGHAYQWPFYRLTSHGSQVLKDPSDATYDPDGYVRRLKERVPAVDSVVVFYVQHAVTCFQYRLLPPAAVMLGCASEKMFLDFTDVFVSALSKQTEQDKLKKELEKARGIKQKYDAVWKRLTPRRNQLPSKLEESLEERLASVFYQVRKVRNDAGHPTGYAPTTEEVHGNLILFPGYVEFIYGLIQYLTGNPLP
jgi:hypothetical protein